MQPKNSSMLIGNSSIVVITIIVISAAIVTVVIVIATIIIKQGGIQKCPERLGLNIPSFEMVHFDGPAFRLSLSSGW